MNKRVLKINKKKPKVRRTWNINPKEQIVPNKRIEDESFDERNIDREDFERGFNGISESDFEGENYDEEFERGFHD